MVLSKNLEEIKKEWKKFVETDNYTPSIIRKEIADSWARSKAAGVDPHGGICNHVLKGKELADLLEENQDLIAIAQPMLHSLYSFLEGSGYYVILANKDVYLLDFFGDPTMEREARNINFMKGACWREECVGTTVLGIMPYFKKPIQMTGCEHYCKFSQDFTCSAAPIFDEEGNMLGLVSISGPVKDMHKHTLGMVVAVANAIQNYRGIIRRNEQLQVVNDRVMNIIKNVSEAIFVYDERGIITFVNPAAQKMIAKNHVEGEHIFSLLKGNKIEKAINNGEFEQIECRLETSNGEKNCLVTGVPIIEGNQEVGAVAVVSLVEKVQNLVKKYSNIQAHMYIENIIGESKEIKKAIKTAKQAAKSSSNVLLQGESGTGKEVFAQAIHNLSDRKNGPFVAVNCGAIPRDLVGSELFGYEEGAFTGALKGGRPGKFELACGGTIFLDEIGDMPLEQQVNLLRVLQEHRQMRIGGVEVIPLDVRVIAASNKSLKEEMKKGDFRSDLFYRLNVISIEIAPLRERPEDIELLFRHYVNHLGKDAKYGEKAIEPEVFRYLENYNWLGNVRELQNVAERMMSLNVGDILQVSDLPDEIYYFSHKEPTKSGDIREHKITTENLRAQIRDENDRDERKLINDILVDCKGNISEAAKRMGISRSTLYRKMKRYGIK